MGSENVWTSQSPVEKITPEKNRIMKTSVIIAGLLLVLVANILVVYYTPYGFYGTSGFSMYEGFQGKKFTMTPEQKAAREARMKEIMATKNTTDTTDGFDVMSIKVEGFDSYYLENAGGAKEQYAPVGAFDGVRLSTGNNVSNWRYTAPNESLMGPEFSPDADNLFMFKNNQCKPECCGASFSCGGGCVCTTPQQRQYIAGRGGNRTEPEDSA
jgi:hypothetical protein